MPDAARLSDYHVCPKVEPGPMPHVGGPIFTGSANVIVGFLPAAREGDSVVCFPVGPVDRIKQGEATVLINERAVARTGDPGTHEGSVITGGCPSVVIGDSVLSFTFRAAAVRGTPFCEKCVRAQRELARRSSAGAAPPPAPDTATLEDERPPPGTHLGRNAASSSPLSLEELARQPDQNDGLTEERRAARFMIAYKFYAAHVSAKPSVIHSHIAGIDLSQPVEVLSVSGQSFYQHGIPDAPDGEYGEYFARDKSLTPDQLGVSASVYGRDRRPPPSKRVQRTSVFNNASASALASIAAPFVDDFSMPGESVECRGGGQQFMIPKKWHNIVPAPVR